jgi:hypothetical protein
MGLSQIATDWRQILRTVCKHDLEQDAALSVGLDCVQRAFDCPGRGSPRWQQILECTDKFVFLRFYFFIRIVRTETKSERNCRLDSYSSSGGMSSTLDRRTIVEDRLSVNWASRSSSSFGHDFSSKTLVRAPPSS